MMVMTMIMIVDPNVDVGCMSKWSIGEQTKRYILIDILQGMSRVAMRVLPLNIWD